MNHGHEQSSLNIDQQVLDTLRLIGSVHPRPGIEKRIAARLAHPPVRSSVRFFGLPRMALASAAGMLASAAIIAGSVIHSHHLLPVAPGMQTLGVSSAGMGAAAAEKVAPKPVTAPPNGRARSMRRIGAGRATATADGQRLSGVAVPKNPLPQHSSQ
jgi:hypothetical protein